jgi:molecular chaperone Hsp33
MESTDGLQRFIFEHAEIRGEIARLEDVYQTITEQRPYPPAVKKILGEALVSCLLLVGSMKFEGELSLQFQGNDALSLMIVQCDHHLNIRGFAKYADDLTDADYQNAFLDGQMSLTISQLRQADTYQSIVPIQSLSMAQNLMNFFALSEQVATLIIMASDNKKVVAMLLQLLPEQNSEQREEFWQYATTLGQTMTDVELLNLSNKTILHRLYHETDIRLLLEKESHFHCRCNPEKMKNVLKVLGQDDVKLLLEEHGKIDVTCDFCNQHYYFDSIDIELIFR